MLDIKVFSSYSDVFVSPLFPEKGGEVSLSIVFSEAPDGILLRADSPSGYLWSYPMERSGTLNGAIRYTAKCTIPCSDEIFHYFFVFFRRGKSYYYSSKGITRSVPSVPDRFSLIPSLEAPSWVASSTCYQIFPDRFCSSGECGAKEGEYEYDGGRVSTPSWDDIPKSFESSRCLDFYNGDLKGIASKASYLSSLGITALYINPVNDSRTVHRYDSADFFHVDPKLGGDEALIDMIRVLHDHGIRIILDISINHTGICSPWYLKALSDPDSDEASFYMHDENGIRFWNGVRTLPELDYRSQKLRDLIYRNAGSAMQKFIRPPFGIDGWRLDVAPEVGRSGDVQISGEIWREVRRCLKDIRHDLYIVGEDWDDSTQYLSGDMWDGVMNYYGAGRIIRSWMGERDRYLSAGWGFDPEREAEWTGEEAAEALMDAFRSLPSQMPFLQMNLFDSHDTPRLHCNSAVMDRSLYHGAVIALFLLPGMPSVYYGDEIGLDGRMGSPEGARYPMQWDEEKWDMERLGLYKAMADIRKMDFLPYSAFSVSGIDSEAFAIYRIGRGKAAVGIINRCPRDRHVSIDAFMLPKNSCTVLYGNAFPEISENGISVHLRAKESAVLLFADTTLPEISGTIA